MASSYIPRDLAWDTQGIRNKLYGRKWRKARNAYLSANPSCVMCKSDESRFSPATVVDHIVPHKGDLGLFWDQSNWQSLCYHHHNSTKAKIEIRGYSDQVGDDGWPVDPMHPANAGELPISGRSRPDELKRINVPVIQVIGPPGSGKSSWCDVQMEADDILIDFDEIATRMYGTRRQNNPLFVPIFRERNRMLLDAADRQSGRVFIPTSLPTKSERDWWSAKLGNVTVVLIDTPLKVCIERIETRLHRSATFDREKEAAANWWRDFERDGVDVTISGTSEFEQWTDGGA